MVVDITSLKAIEECVAPQLFGAWHDATFSQSKLPHNSGKLQNLDIRRYRWNAKRMLNVTFKGVWKTQMLSDSTSAGALFHRMSSSWR